MKGFAVLLLLGLSLSAEAFADKKDFKGMFGSYQRERYTENEGNSSNFGVDILLSTLLPVSSYVDTIESAGGSPNNMNYSTAFNVEASFFYTLAYNFELFLNVGYYSYDTRRQNPLPGTSTLPLFEQFSMNSTPAILGLRYRLSTSDIVPYFGAGVGASYVSRQASYDYAPQQATTYNTVLTAELIGGFEFFFTARAGIRMEVSAYYMQLPTYTFDPSNGGAINQYPIFEMNSNPWSVRYASGIFFLF